MQMLAHVGAHGYIPRTPYKIFQQHHDGKLNACRCFHFNVLVLFLNVAEKLQKKNNIDSYCLWFVDCNSSLKYLGSIPKSQHCNHKPQTISNYKPQTLS